MSSYDPISLGARCFECPLNGRKPVPPQSNPNARLVIIGESPGQNEEVAQKPFVGKSGAIIDAICNRNHINRGSLHITNAIKCRPKKGMRKGEISKAVYCCRPLLRRELDSIVSVRGALLLGGRALQALTGKQEIFAWMGGPDNGREFTEKGTVFKASKKIKEPFISFSDWRLIPSLHPAFALRQPWWTPVIEIMFLRALDMAEGRLKPFVWPQIIVEPGKEMNDALRELRKAGRPLGVDTETTAKDPMMARLLNVGLCNDYLGVSVPWQEADSQTRALCKGAVIFAKSISGQNFQYDIVTSASNNFPVKYEPLNGRFWDRSRLKKAFRGFDFDTRAAHQVIAPLLKHNLATQMAIESHAERWKDDFKLGSDESGFARFQNADPTLRGIYNVKDCYATEFLRPILTKRLQTVNNGMKLFNEYMALIWVAVDMQLRGVPVHKAKFEAHKTVIGTKVHEAWSKVKTLTTRLGFPDFKDHYLQVGKAFQVLGASSPKESDHGNPSYDADVLTSFLASPDPVIQALAEALLTHRRWAKLYKTYILGLSMDNCWVTHPSWNVYGARTGRWSCQNPNLMNIPHPKFKYDEASNTKIQITPGLHDLFGAMGG